MVGLFWGGPVDVTLKLMRWRCHRSQKMIPAPRFEYVLAVLVVRIVWA